MTKKTIWWMLITSLVTLLPIVAGLILCNVLPEQMATHYGIDGTPDATGSKWIVVAGIPLLMFAVHIVVMALCVWDQKRRQQDRKAIGMMMWVFPLISCYVSGVMYAAAFGLTFSANLMLPLLGLLLMFMGNYLPKCRQNPTLGIKIKWTLESEENWNATHRFTGKLWFIGGGVMMLGIFLPSVPAIVAMIVSLAVLTVFPVVYSYRFYRRQKQGGTFKEKLAIDRKTYKSFKIASLIVVPLILIAVTVLTFTGDVTVTVGEKALTVGATYASEATIEYADIDSIEYREHCEVGSRLFGYAGARLLQGSFQNDEFGNYTRYSYTGCKAAVVIKTGNQTLVISGEDAASTKAVYEQIAAKCEQGA